MVSQAFSLAPVASGLAPPTPKAARRPGMAADVSTSVGRRVGADATRPVGSMQAFASASVA
eukprot:7577850-Alexandrium_andersonii.AAC.1